MPEPWSPRGWIVWHIGLFSSVWQELAVPVSVKGREPLVDVGDHRFEQDAAPYSTDTHLVCLDPERFGQADRLAPAVHENLRDGGGAGYGTGHASSTPDLMVDTKSVYHVLMVTLMTTGGAVQP
ncbi:hypothetical protein [Phytoactinopolyspora alkaliphila]|uniref:hypothetical protein n=1 Tax=Phytoactinopolyspora alkaliphila TaxID=1783498 RepID=UPI001FE91BAC|nr:hypothetical protein [Phytoactinopolyspora alkaliphila]